MSKFDQDNGEWDFDDDVITEKISVGNCSGCSGCGKEKECDGPGSCGPDCECEPKNNNGRDVCYWCNRKTTLVIGFSFNYDYCVECKK